jgi:hypothetical protein
LSLEKYDKTSFFAFVCGDKLRPTLMGGARMLCDNGAFVRFDKAMPPVNILRDGQPIDRETVEGLVFDLCAPTLHALKLLNCQNVGSEPTETWAVEKRACRNIGGKPGREVRFHTLHLKLPKERKLSFASMLTDERHYGLHTVRGVFRTYTADKPLFGKHVGRWWWHPHMRGDEVYGTIEKDYKIESYP